MTNPKIYSIVCAVRGQPTSRETVTRAIDLALAHQARLIFVHITNVDFLNMATPGMSSTRRVYHQLREMAEFTRLLLCDRANRRGVEQADSIIREGDIQPQLYQLLIELRPDLLVIGEPRHDAGDAVFAGAELEEFLSRLGDEINLHFEIVKPD